jgi:hypothetical protein
LKSYIKDSRHCSSYAVFFTLASPLVPQFDENNITDLHEFGFALGETVAVMCALLAFEALYMM